ncbi:BspA family leucine-rich repeat surface protein [Bifidobacterium sp. ESL0763]|uniref:BspA family leucine-rich repeat surface protein n=1 Tax=Bifidobacterium sp. ESL0763 TaxID=2983227 RepID=UPI0023F9A178|nr:BspA family leucine-rich repeat surface protein [Bifidobacterium sp. ESL0763]MDF7663511.1 BspA family leucine-rich repeat surface protein [Bifidobacterium sp. ESL0763]
MRTTVAALLSLAASVATLLAGGGFAAATPAIQPAQSPTLGYTQKAPGGGLHSSSVLDAGHAALSSRGVACVPVAPTAWGTSTWSVVDEGPASDANGAYEQCTLHLTSGSVNIRPSDEVTNIPWHDSEPIRDSITKVSIDGPLTVDADVEAVKQPNADLYNGLFADMKALRSAEVPNDTSTSDSLVLLGLAPECLFRHDVVLTSVDSVHWDMSGATSISNVFVNAISLSQVDVSQWNTGNVKDMHGAFWGVQSLGSVDVAHWDTAKVKRMNGLFCGDNSLRALDLSGWNTGAALRMDQMFAQEEKLETLITGPHWDTSQVQTMNSMFAQDPALASLDVSGWNTGSVTNMGGMFYLDASLRTLDVSNWDTSNVTDMNTMFEAMDNLSSLGASGVSGWNTAKVTNMSFMFSASPKLTSLDLTDWNTAALIAADDNKMNGLLPPNLERLVLGSDVELSSYSYGAFLSVTNTLGWVQINDGNVSSLPEHGRYVGLSVDLAELTARSGGAPGTYVARKANALHLDANGGESSADDVTGFTDAGPAVPEPVGLSKPHCLFDSWNAKANGSGDTHAIGERRYLPEGTTAIYAQWHEVAAPVITTPSATHTIPPTGGSFDVSGTWSPPAGAKLVVSVTDHGGTVRTHTYEPSAVETSSGSWRVALPTSDFLGGTNTVTAHILVHDGHTQADVTSADSDPVRLRFKLPVAAAPLTGGQVLALALLGLASVGLSLTAIGLTRKWLKRSLVL